MFGRLTSGIDQSTFDKAGQVGAVLLAASGNPAGQQLLANQTASNKQQAELQRQLALAQYKLQNPEQPANIRALIAAGIDPTSAQGQDIIRQSLVRPLVVGGGEGIAPALVDPTRSQTANGPPAEAIQQLRANPSLSAQFDEVFGAGAAQRALGGG